jgi:aminomethyltransferase
MDATTTALEASLGWAIARSRRAGGKKEAGFPGAGSLSQVPARRLVGLVGDEPVPIRHGAPILDSEKREVGVVTSGTLSPSTQRAIMLAYVKPGIEKLYALVRGAARPVRVAPLPFVPKRYKR